MTISSMTRAAVALRPKSVGAVLLTALVTPACSAATSADPRNREGAVDRSVIENDSNVRYVSDAARARFTDGDVRFMTALIAYRAQDRAMAELAGTQSDDPRVRLLARRILANHEDEIVLIRDWLRDRAQPIPDLQARGAMPLADGADRLGYVSGMVTWPQFADFERATGRDFDRLFLTYSIQHFLAADMLVNTLLLTEGGSQDPTVSRLVSSVEGEQAVQVARMQDMLMELSSAGRER